jgi:hypothetical protein
MMHKLFNNTNQLQLMSDNNKIVINNIKKEWFKNKNEVKKLILILYKLLKKKKIVIKDLYFQIYKIIFYINMLNFAGEEVYNNYKEEFLNLFSNCDYSKINPLTETFLRKVGIKTSSIKSFEKMSSLLIPIIKKRIESNLNKQDMLNSVILEILNKEEYNNDKFLEIVMMYMFNMVKNINLF